MRRSSTNPVVGCGSFGCCVTVLLPSLFPYMSFTNINHVFWTTEADNGDAEEIQAENPEEGKETARP